MTTDSGRAFLPRTLLVCVATAIASQVGPASSVWPVLPAFSTTSRSPSSDVMAQALPLPSAGQALATLARDLPDAPGVVVVDGPAASSVAAYYVISTHLWPRPILLVSCEPGPVRHFPFAIDERRPIAWRIDMRPGQQPPLVSTMDGGALTPAAWCGGVS